MLNYFVITFKDHEIATVSGNWLSLNNSAVYWPPR